MSFPEEDLERIARYFADRELEQDGARGLRFAQIIRQAIQARNDELMASREVIADLRGQLGKLRAERDAQLAAIQSWRISANLARNHDEALMHLALQPRPR